MWVCYCVLWLFFCQTNISFQYNVCCHVWYHLTSHLQVDEIVFVSHTDHLDILNCVGVLWGGECILLEWAASSTFGDDGLTAGWLERTHRGQAAWATWGPWYTNRVQETGKPESVPAQQHCDEDSFFYSGGHLSPLQREAECWIQMPPR